MKFTVAFLAALGCCPLAALSAVEPPTAKPNILLIYSDDHGWADLGVQGVDKDVCTPNLDQLARDGVRFARGYVTAPQCVPSRAGLLTGRYQQRFGVEDNSKGPLPVEEMTIAERLKHAGYVTGMVGKWHLDLGGERSGDKTLRIQREHMPHEQGFDEYWRGEMRQFYASHDLQGKPFEDAPHLAVDNRFRVIVQTEAALSFLDRRAAKPQQPWFLYLAWYAPHVPLESPEPWFSRTSESLPLQRRQALAMIAAMDDGLGRIRAKLKAMNAEQNTLIFFIGDNGAPLGGAWDGSLNLPMIGQKGMVAEGGVRVPFVAAWPGGLPAGLVYDQPVISLDVAATAVALAGLPQDAQLDGVNLVPFLSGEKKTAPHEALYWRWASQSSVLEMPYKYIKLGNRPPLLFDVTQPEGENSERNLAARHPDIAARLEQKLQSWAAGLKPPGLATEESAFSRHHEELFAAHRIIVATSAEVGKPNRKPAPAGSVQGWICRNGTLTVQNGALIITPAPSLTGNARPFIACTGIDLDGPLTAMLRVRSKVGGKSTLTWRTKARSFAPEQAVTFHWPASTDWQEVKLDVNEADHILHIRITPSQAASGVEIQSIELQGRGTQSKSWTFTQERAAGSSTAGKARP
jgi:arylsulfatase A-like enzyme